MKRSKLFLGLTTGLLAVVGIVAARTQRHSTEYAVRTSPTGNPCGGFCLDKGAIVSTTTITPGELLVTSGSNRCTIFTNVNFNQVCVTPLYSGD